MHKKYFCFLFLIALFSFSGKQNENIYISMTFLGDPTKPFPSILLYVPGSNTSSIENRHIKKIEISSCQFLEIKRLTEMNLDVLHDTILKNPYQIVYINNEETTIFRTKCLSRIKQVFELLSLKFSKGPPALNVQDALKTLLLIFRSKDEIDRIY